MIDKYLLNHIEEVKALCKANYVEQLYAFGSIVDGRFKEGKSDIDLLVSFDRQKITKKEEAKHLLIMWMSLQKLLKCSVDLILNSNIEGEHFKKYLELYKEKIFDNS